MWEKKGIKIHFMNYTYLYCLNEQNIEHSDDTAHSYTVNQILMPIIH